MSEITKEEFNFEEALENSMRQVRRGQRVSGVVTEVRGNEVVVDIGTKHTGFVPADELTDDSSAKIDDIVKKGDELTLVVISVSDMDGIVTLSKKRADAQEGLNEVIAAASANAEVDMVAMNADKSQIVIAGIETANDKTAGMTAEKYLETEEQEMTASIGGNYSLTTNSAEVTFAGIDRKLPASITTLNVNGATLVICQTVAEKDGSFFSAIAMGASEDEVTKAFENFAATTV
jgi:predicted RNA-binding protein with RPS1 domain